MPTVSAKSNESMNKGGKYYTLRRTHYWAKHFSRLQILRTLVVFDGSSHLKGNYGKSMKKSG